MALNLIFAAALILSPQENAPAPCTAGATPDLPVAYATWATPRDVTGATDQARAPGARLSAGQTAAATLAPLSQITFPNKPDRVFPPASFGGLFEIAIGTAGQYEVSLGSGGWIDVVFDGKVLESVDHHPGPACTGVRKVVAFDLKPGRYIIQIAGNPQATVPVLVSRKP